MANKMLIDATHPEETRVVVLRGNRVEEFDFETALRKQLRGNIYLAKVTRVEPSLQAAFVEYGGNRHGFLAFSEIHPDYYQIPVADRQALIDDDARNAHDDDDDEPRGRHRHGRHRHREQRRPSHGDEAVRSDEAVHGDELAAEELRQEAADVPAGETMTGAPLPEPLPFEAAPPPEQTYEVALEPAPVGEDANPPVPAEIASEPEPRMAAREPEALAETPTDAQAQDAETPDQPFAPSEDAQPALEASDRDADSNGNGVEEEEEVVESVGGADAMEEVPARTPRYRRQYKIQEVIKRRQVMLVQVVKEERGTKGAALTTYLSLAGRYCVLMPNTARGGGISRKITSAEDRRKLREIADELDVPEGMGVILRTAGAARTKAEVKRDFEYLLRQWELVRDLTLRSTAPMLVYEEGSLVKRSIRDLYSKDIEEIVVAGEDGYRDARDFMRMLMPSHAKNVKLYKDSQPIFTRYAIESQLDAMFSPTVQLRSGGYIVINQTEALVAIDVNSGRSTREHHIEDTALKTNVEAAEEIARQLRLRDLAGLIVIDFIDMDEKRNNRTVERRLKDALRNDRARIQVGRISHFGLLEMSRQRIRTSVLESSTEKCALCGGTGHVRSVSSVSLQLLRALEETLLKGATHNMGVRTRPEIALYVLNHKRAHLRTLEERFRISITVNADAEIGGQVGFAIDRGEQVMTIEQARALAAQAETAPQPQADADEEATATDVVDEAFDVAETTDDGGMALLGETPSAAHEDAEHGTDRESGRGRRRRRRGRGRGRGVEGRDADSPDTQPQHQPDHDHPDTAATFGAALAEPRDAASEAMAFESAEPRAAHGEANGNGNGNGDGEGERRRRRRGRRGGRRNRRDREGQPLGEFTGAPEMDLDRGPAPNAEADQPERDWSTPPRQPQPPQQQPTFGHSAEVHERPFEPMEYRPAAPELIAAPPEPQVASTPEAQTPRRRSTVREPAPLFSESSPMPPLPRPEPLPTPVVSSSADANEGARPRRTGGWARRLLGGEKGQD
jgi:ribonuclease E